MRIRTSNLIRVGKFLRAFDLELISIRWLGGNHPNMICLKINSISHTQDATRPQTTSYAILDIVNGILGRGDVYPQYALLNLEDRAPWTQFTRWVE